MMFLLNISKPDDLLKMNRPLLLLILTLFCLPAALQAKNHVKETPLSIDSEALAVIYSGQEKMHFSVSWSGGVKIGDLYMTVAPEASGDGLLITARVTDYGLFKFFYPVNDTFITAVRGPLKLPYRYDVHQLEGSMEVRRRTTYDQQKFELRYRKHENPTTLYMLTGPTYNEFSSFFITRSLRLNGKCQQIIPSFVDKKRHKVAVKVLGKEKKETLFGLMNTIKVMPKMYFKGLYNKDGDTVFWLTDDACRVPVEIRSKILVGSLVAELVEYSNPACRAEFFSGKDIAQLRNK
ncbi:MAG: DUF3108 domain-containing protein [Candidatus Electrothrix sp. AR4]|nr:DUF3108 domain-containing protein [Candidatus Electrothrix sp. AR4]